MIGGLVLIAIGHICSPRALQSVGDATQRTKLHNLFSAQVRQFKLFDTEGMHIDALVLIREASSL